MSGEIYEKKQQYERFYLYIIVIQIYFIYTVVAIATEQKHLCIKYI